MMRRRTESGLWAIILLVPLLIAGSAASEKEVDDGIDVYFRDVDLGALSNQALEQYPDTEPGESELLERAFEGVPPQISHSVEDMLPITLGDNECLECHHPENAVEGDDVPLTEAHFERAVMSEGKPGEGMVWIVKGYEKAELIGARYDCMMCHAPQASNVKTPRNLFKGEKLPTP
jgi:cytochrome c-type protein NapB